MNVREEAMSDTLKDHFRIVIACLIVFTFLTAIHSRYTEALYFWDESSYIFHNISDFYQNKTSIYLQRNDTGNAFMGQWIIARGWDIFGSKPKVGRLINILEAAIALVFAFRIFALVEKKIPAFTGAALLAILPTFFSHIPAISLEMTMTMFFMLSTYFFLRKKWIAFIICGALMHVTKGYAFVVYFAFYAGAWIGVLLEERSNLFTKLLKRTIPVMIPTLLFGLYCFGRYLLRGYWLTSPNYSSNLRVISDPGKWWNNFRRVAECVMGGNGNWIFLALFCLGIAAFIIRRPRKLKVSGPEIAQWLRRNSRLVTIHTVFLLSLIGLWVSYSFHTHGLCHRYWIPFYPGIVLLGIHGMRMLLIRNRRILIFSVLLSTFFIIRYHNTNAAVLPDSLEKYFRFTDPDNLGYFPPYHYNLDYWNYLEAHQETAHYISEFHPSAMVVTEFPLSAILTTPAYGFVDQPLDCVPMKSIGKHMNTIRNRETVLLAVSGDINYLLWRQTYLLKPYVTGPRLVNFGRNGLECHVCKLHPVKAEADRNHPGEPEE